MNDIHTTILESYFFHYIDRRIGADETPLFTSALNGQPLSAVIAADYGLSSEDAEAAILAAREEVWL